MLNDPIADLLTRIRNACRARKDRVDVPWSRTKESIVRVLLDEGYLKDFAAVGEGVEKVLRISLRYDARRVSVITDLQRVSRPSLRVYVGAEEAPRVRGGMGVNILSTNKGVMPDHEARKQQVGGEVLCAVW
jgi:small subunit ribosomal protein S8